tara:strand:- start:2416 stop:2799 length:384 start_codon:yes stop_codon:yes gene_type:complete
MNRWYLKLKQSKLSPPSWVFGVVWPLLYSMMAISLFIAWNSKQCFPYCNALTYFFIQLFFNLIWTTLFFKLKLIKTALANLALIIIFTFLTIKKFYLVNKLASYLLVPYFIWLCFAFYLNLFIVLNN